MAGVWQNGNGGFGKGMAVFRLTVDVEAQSGQADEELVEDGREIQRESLGEGRQDLNQAEDDLRTEKEREVMGRGPSSTGSRPITFKAKKRVSAEYCHCSLAISFSNVFPSLCDPPCPRS